MMDDLPAAPRLPQVARVMQPVTDEPVTEVFSRCRWCGAFHLMDCPYILEQEWYESGAKKRTVLASRVDLHEKVSFYSEEEVQEALAEGKAVMEIMGADEPA